MGKKFHQHHPSQRDVDYSDILAGGRVKSGDPSPTQNWPDKPPWFYFSGLMRTLLTGSDVFQMICRLDPEMADTAATAIGAVTAHRSLTSSHFVVLSALPADALLLQEAEITAVAGRGGMGAVQVVVGVDTHQDKHVAVAIDQRGCAFAERSAPETSYGYGGFERWSRRLGEVRVFGVEGMGSYSAGLARSRLYRRRGQPS